MKQLLFQLRSNKRTQLFALMCVATGFNFSLLAYRLHYIGFNFGNMAEMHDEQLTFIFLVWNLFLAWIPYWIALSLRHLEKVKFSKVLLSFSLILWLLFFPNAPYIITDLLHISVRPPVPLWYDVMLIFSFAWTGLMLGLLSLYEVQQFLMKYLSKTMIWIFLFASLFLCGIGIFIGRFQRWNSWDIVTNPFGLINDILNTLFHPLLYLNTFGLSFVLFGFLAIGYLVLTTLLSRSN